MLEPVGDFIEVGECWLRGCRVREVDGYTPGMVLEQRSFCELRRGMVDNSWLISSPSKGAPIPFPCQARRNTASLIIRTPARSFVHSFRRGIWCQTFPPRSSFDPVFFPLPVHSPAMSTCPIEAPLRMIVPVLVQWYLPYRVLPAKDIPAVPAMVPSLEESEIFLADRRIADLGGRVCFPKIARGWACDFWEVGGRYGLL